MSAPPVLTVNGRKVGVVAGIAAAAAVGFLAGHQDVPKPDECTAYVQQKMREEWAKRPLDPAELTLDKLKMKRQKYHDECVSGAKK